MESKNSKGKSVKGKEKFYEIGSKLGLSEKEVNRVLRAGAILIIIGILIAFLLFISRGGSSSPSQNPPGLPATYPKGTYYGTISINDFMLR